MTPRTWARTPLALLLLLCAAATAGANDPTRNERLTRAMKFGKRLNQLVELLHDGAVAEPSPEELCRWSIEEIARGQNRKVPARFADPRLRPSADRFAEAYYELIEGPGPDPDTLVWQVGKAVLARFDHFGKVIPPDNVIRFGCGGVRYVGVGMSVERDPRSGLFRVITPIKGGPAYKAGLRAGDLITTITPDLEARRGNINNRDVVSIKALPDAMVHRLIQGIPGTRLRVTADRPGGFLSREFILKRDYAAEETVLGRQHTRGDGWDHWLDRKHKIAYVRITRFGRNTAKEVRTTLRGLLAEGMRGLVLDLRFNPGGLLDSSLKIADLFIGEGLIVRIRQRARRETPFRAKRKGTLPAFSMVCLINGKSASGSEILAACLQDHKRALIVGRRSLGKGSVRNVVYFQKGKLVISTAAFLSPSGRKLDLGRVKGLPDEQWGVTPDKGHRVRLSAEDRGRLKKHLEEMTHIHPRPRPDTFRDPQRDHALAWLRERLSASG